jgi:hypothetical protein
VKRTEREIARDSSAGGKFSALVLAICQGVLSGVGRAAFGRACESGAMAQQVAHLLCKQGVRGSSPLGSTLVSGTFASRRNCERPEYSSKVQQRCRRVVMLSGLRAARRAPSTLSKSSRWSLGCIHPSSPRSGCGAVSAWPPAGVHLGQRAKMRRPCGWHAPSS